MKFYTVKLFLDSIVEGPGAGTRGQVMMSVQVWAASEGAAKWEAEKALTRLLQRELNRP